jgi:chlorophyll synthase
MAVPQAIVLVLLVQWGMLVSALAVGTLLLVQFGLMMRMLRDPKALAPWYNATGTSCYVLGMLAAALGLGRII